MPTTVAELLVIEFVLPTEIEGETAFKREEAKKRPHNTKGKMFLNETDEHMWANNTGLYYFLIKIVK